MVLRRSICCSGGYDAAVRLVLASNTPRRRELLHAAGFEFDVAAIDVDETRGEGEPAERYVERLAQTKARAAVRRGPDLVVVGADTVVVVGGEVLGKPRDTADAARMLRRLSGRSHEVLTGVAVARRGQMLSRVERTSVWFVRVSDAEIAWYLASGEPMDKAGAYAIQGRASRFIPRIDGSYSNVVGLPMAAVVELLEKAGFSAEPAARPG
jgi:septum formation protein